MIHKSPTKFSQVIPNMLRFVSALLMLYPLFNAQGGDHLASWTLLRRTRDDNTRPLSVVRRENTTVAVGRQICTATNGVWAAPIYSSQLLYSVTYGNGMFVAVGEGGAIRTSSTGETWTSQTSGTGALLSAIDFDNELFTVVGSNGTILTSTNGTTWIPRTSPITDAFYSVASGNGIHAAVGASGSIVTSTDGVTWTTQLSGVSSRLSRVSYGNGTFVAVGDNGTILSSADGVVWMKSSLSPPNIYTTITLDALAFGNGTFVASGEAVYANGPFSSTSHFAAVMNDGLHWTTAPFQGDYTFIELSYSSGVFVGISDLGDIIESSAKIDWHLPLRSSGTTSDLNSVVFANGIYVAVGNGGVVLTSINGTT